MSPVTDPAIIARIKKLEEGQCGIKAEVLEVRKEVKEIREKTDKLDRDGAKGCLVISGKGLPARDKRTREGPLTLISDLAWKMFQIKIRPDDVISCSRMGAHVRSPIFVRY